MNKTAMRRHLRRLELAMAEKPEAIRDIFPGLPEGGETVLAAVFLNVSNVIAVRTNDRETTLRAAGLMVERCAANLIAAIVPAFVPLPWETKTRDDLEVINDVLRAVGWDVKAPRVPGLNYWSE